MIVHNLAAAQRFKGCTIIKGVLEIQIHGGCEILISYFITSLLRTYYLLVYLLTDLINY